MTDAAGGLGSTARAGQTHARFPCFDGLRAVAAFAVLLTHVAFISGFSFRSSLGALTARLDVGVAVFFLISGFLLYRPFVVARLNGDPPPRPAAYFWRRGLRIFPAYWLALTITIFVLDIPPDVPSGRDLFLYYGLLHLYSLDTLFGPILASYTLVTEVSFYVFLPIYAFAIGFRPGPARQHVRRDLAALTCLFVAGAAYRLIVAFADPPGRRDFQLQNILPGWIDVFAVGMALAVVSAWFAHRQTEAPAPLSKPWMPAASWTLGGLAFVLVSVYVGGPTPNEVFTVPEELAIHYLYLAVAFFLLLPAVFGRQDRSTVRAFLRNPVVAWLGLISYGVYLWNETIIEKYLDWADKTPFNTYLGSLLLVVVVATIAVAAASFYLLERPVLRLKSRVRDRPRSLTTARE
jgi:peptidoglycan/LPS O-acetylase OafA/YrhL